MTIEDIEKGITRVTCVSSDMIHSRSQSRAVCEARSMFAGACRRVYPPITLEEIAHYTGRHRTTVINSLKAHEGLLLTDAIYKKKFESIFDSKTRDISAFALFKPNGDIWGWLSDKEWQTSDPAISVETGWTCRSIKIQIPI